MPASLTAKVLLFVQVKSSITTYPSTAEIVPEPLGVVLVISAWNYPFCKIYDLIYLILSASTHIEVLQYSLLVCKENVLGLMIYYWISRKKLIHFYVEIVFSLFLSVSFDNVMISPLLWFQKTSLASSGIAPFFWQAVHFQKLSLICQIYFIIICLKWCSAEWKKHGKIFLWFETRGSSVNKPSLSCLFHKFYLWFLRGILSVFID